MEDAVVVEAVHQAKRVVRGEVVEVVAVLVVFADLLLFVFLSVQLLPLQVTPGGSGAARTCLRKNK